MSELNLSLDDKQKMLEEAGYTFYSVRRFQEDCRTPEGWSISLKYDETVREKLINLAWYDANCKGYI